MQWFLSAMVLAAAIGAGCSHDTSSSTAPSQLSLSGTWSGNLTLQDTPAQMKWTLTQSGAAVSGPVLVLLPNGVVLLNGTLSGTLGGTTLTYTIGVAAGAVPSNPACTGQLSGSASVATGTTSTMTGSYTVSVSSCPTTISNGSFTLTRQ